MPFSIEFPLSLRDGIEIPPHILRNNAYRWFGLAEPANAAHEGDSESRPFRVSTLVGDRGRGSFRIALLDDALHEPLTGGMAKEPFVRVHERILHFAGPPHSVGARYEDVLHRAGQETTATLEFLTPTAFRVDGMAYVLPDPIRVFGGYFDAWNRFAPPALRIAAAWLEWARRSIAISRMKLQTDVLRFDNHIQIGFVGQVRFDTRPANPSDHSAEATRLFNALADFSFFSGTGHKTSQGMGQTRRV